ncbi:MAG: hypothetical protein AAF621_03950 [Pseudomonadota bacterium]
MIIKAGQFVTSIPNLSKATGLSIHQVRKCLRRLNSTGEITEKTTNKYRIITVTNYAKYQHKEYEQKKGVQRSRNEFVTQRQHTQQTSNRQTTDKKHDVTDCNETEFCCLEPEQKQANNRQTTDKQQTNDRQTTANKEYNNKNNIPPVVPHGGNLEEKKEGEKLSEFYEGNDRDQFKKTCIAIAAKRKFTAEAAEHEFDKFETYWLSPALTERASRKKDWRKTFSNWISKQAPPKPPKNQNIEIAKEIHEEAIRCFKAYDLIDESSSKINSHLPFLIALNKGYSRAEIAETLNQVLETPPQSQIYSWAYINQFFK